jgi:hypothetical protein
MTTRPADPSVENTLVFLYDVDNTLLDNDRLKAEATQRLAVLIGAEWADRFWEIYEAVRAETDVVDIPESLRRFHKYCSDPAIARTAQRVFDTIDFDSYLYPGALDVLKYTEAMGNNVILSDGDQVFQQRKVDQSGIARAAENRVLIYVHKEEHLDEILAYCPGEIYILVDDKPRIGKAMQKLLGDRLRVVFVCQGHYAHDPVMRAGFHPNLTLSNIGDLIGYSFDEFCSGHFLKQGECEFPES